MQNNIKRWWDDTEKEKQWWDNTKTDLILKIDLPYVRNYCLNHFGNDIRERCRIINSQPQYVPHFKCELCSSGNYKKGKTPACFYPTEVGYVYSCVVCEPSLTLFKFFEQVNPEIAQKYQWERWHKKLTGSCYNCPEPPKALKREYYKKKEQELKERNKREYLIKNQNF